jgi:hypothetical protein
MAYKQISPQPVVEGGTGVQTITGVLTGNGTSPVTANAVTENGILIGASSNAVASLGVATNGQILIGSTGTTPVLGAITSTGGTVAVSNGAGTINLEVTGFGLSWSSVAIATAAVVGNGYFVSSAAQITLPGAPANGSVVSVYCAGTGGTTVICQGGDQIQMSSQVTAVNGNIATVSTPIGYTVTLVYNSSINDWCAISVNGSWSIN